MLPCDETPKSHEGVQRIEGQSALQPRALYHHSVNKNQGKALASQPVGPVSEDSSSVDARRSARGGNVGPFEAATRAVTQHVPKPGLQEVNFGQKTTDEGEERIV